MFDFRLKVFLSVAQRMSFTKAAAELFISQPAVSKHIKEIEKHYQCTLFDRNGNRLKLTPKGEILKKYALKISALYREMESEINVRNTEHYGFINIGASTTAAQYVLPKFLASFKNTYPQIKVSLKTGNTEYVEELLSDHQIEVGIVEGESKRNSLNYFPFQKDEIVLCTNPSTNIPSILNIEDLKKLPFIIREKGSGTLEIIRTALHKRNLKLDELNIEMIFENNESIKTYLKNSNTFAFVSISAILNELKNNRLKIIDVANLSMDRYYYVVLKKENQNPIAKLLKERLIHNY